MPTHLTGRELHTVLAALRFYQERGQCDPANRSAPIEDLASNLSQIQTLESQEIDRLCAMLNRPDDVPSSDEETP
jgi:hypothetical protein